MDYKRWSRATRIQAAGPAVSEAADPQTYATGLGSTASATLRVNGCRPVGGNSTPSTEPATEPDCLTALHQAIIDSARAANRPRVPAATWQRGQTDWISGRERQPTDTRRPQLRAQTKLRPECRAGSLAHKLGGARDKPKRPTSAVRAASWAHATEVHRRSWPALSGLTCQSSSCERSPNGSGRK